MNLTFRQATLDDLEEMQHLFVETIKAICKNDYDTNQIDAWVSSVENVNRWKSFLNNQYFIIAEIKGKMVGYGSLENGNYLDFLYVHKDFQQKGIANKIYEKLKEKSIALGSEKLTSDVSKTAVPFFKSKGFEIVRENKNQMNSVEIINYHMSQ